MNSSLLLFVVLSEHGEKYVKVLRALNVYDLLDVFDVSYLFDAFDEMCILEGLLQNGLGRETHQSGQLEKRHFDKYNHGVEF